MSNVRLPRRRFLALGAASLGGTLLTGCDRLSEAPDFQEFLSSAEWLTYRVQRLLGSRHAVFRGVGQLIFEGSDRIACDVRIGPLAAARQTDHDIVSDAGDAGGALRIALGLPPQPKSRVQPSLPRIA